MARNSKEELWVTSLANIKRGILLSKKTAVSETFYNH